MTKTKVVALIVARLIVAGLLVFVGIYIGRYRGRLAFKGVPQDIYDFCEGVEYEINLFELPTSEAYAWVSSPEIKHNRIMAVSLLMEEWIRLVSSESSKVDTDIKPDIKYIIQGKYLVGRNSQTQKVFAYKIY